MAALVQTFPQQPSTVTMLQGQPSSSGGSFSQQHSASRSQQLPRFPSPSSSGSYRGLPSSGLVAPYAFTSTPQLTNNAAFLQNATSPHLRPQNRTVSAPSLVVGNQQPASLGPNLSTRPRFATSSSLSTASTSSSSLQPSKISMDDASINTRETSVDFPARPKSTIGLSPSSSMQLANSLTLPKPSPDRYRRGIRPSPPESSHNSGLNKVQSTSSAGAGSSIPNVGHLFTGSSNLQAGPSAQTLQPFGSDNPARTMSSDDLSLVRPQGSTELAQRYRRRSVGSFEAIGDLTKPSPQPLSPPMHANRSETPNRRQSPETQRPSSSHTHHGSSDSVSSTRSAKSAGQHPVSTFLIAMNIRSDYFRTEKRTVPKRASMLPLLCKPPLSRSKRSSSSMFLPVMMQASD